MRRRKYFLGQFVITEILTTSDTPIIATLRMDMLKAQVCIRNDRN